MSRNGKGMTFFKMLRDVLIASLNRGQFPIAIVGLILVITVCRMPPEDLGRLMFRLLDAAEAHEYGGYVLSAVIALGCAVLGKRQRREMTVEIKRLNEQCVRLQEMTLDARVKSSGRRR